MGELLLVLFWGGLLWFIAATPWKKLEMVWLGSIFLILLSGVIPILWMAIR